MELANDYYASGRVGYAMDINKKVRVYVSALAGYAGSDWAGANGGGTQSGFHEYLFSARGTYQVMKGLELEDGFIKPDKISYITNEPDKTQVGMELHSGRNRIVRRIFEHLGYKVVKLDRVFFAGLTKKDLPRGKFRELTKEEVNILRRIS